MATNENNPCTCTTPEYTIILNQQGPSGRQGETGQDGFSPIIDVNTNTRDTYILTITTADGVITTPNLKSEPIPSGGTEGQVLTNTGQDNYGWAYLPQATPQSQGVVRLSTDEDFQPDEEGNVNDTTAVTPQTLVDYVSTHGGSDLKNITDIDSGVAITDADSGLTYPQTINIITASENNNYSCIECKSSGSGLSSAIQLNLDTIILRGGLLSTNSYSGGVQFSFDGIGAGNPRMIVSEPVCFKGGQISSNTVSNLLAFDYIHTTGTSGNFNSNGFFIFDRQSSYAKTFTTNGILFTAGNEPSIKFTTSTSINGIWTDTINATVLTDKSGIVYKSITQAEYNELETKSENTIYRTTDTNKVYLGTIELTGGSGTVAAVTTTVNAPPQCVSEVTNVTTSVTIEDYVPPVEE